MFLTGPLLKIGFLRRFARALNLHMADHERPARAVGVEGHEGRKNDVIYRKPITKEGNPDSTVVFFGGDVQDYSERMMAHRDNHRYVEWNLEATCERIATRFPNSEVLVVRPSRMLFSTFSCYDNFVTSSQNGAPTYSPNYGAITHLTNLISSVSKLKEASNDDGTSLSNETETPLILVGFSKGCVVLNQIVYELHHGKDDPNVNDFVLKVKDMFWLDGGHAGGSKVWITDKEILRTLAETDIRIHVHVTPYQMEDTNRPWIRKEENIFTETLRRFGAKLDRNLHFDGEIPSIEKHFELITTF